MEFITECVSIIFRIILMRKNITVCLMYSSWYEVITIAFLERNHSNFYLSYLS